MLVFIVPLLLFGGLKTILGLLRDFANEINRWPPGMT
jgi:hypothetical protein